MEDYLKPYSCCPRCGSLNVSYAQNGPHLEFRCDDCDFSSFVKKVKNADKDNHTKNRLLKWAQDVKKRDGYKCVICGRTDGLDAHHIIPKKDHPEYEFQVENGVTLCREHHAMVHPYMINYMKKVYGNYEQ